MSVRAPEFPAHLEWVNTAQPVKLADLKGRAVLLEFWTSCCINCHHNLARLREVRARYGPELAILAIHSGKFGAESSSAMIAQAAERYGLHHPCLNDKDFEVWQEYCVSCWPTVVAVDPQGKVAFVSEGEFDPDRLKDRLDALVSQATVHDPLPTLPQKHSESSLRYPSKITCSDTHLYVSDTGHGRVLEMTFQQEVVREFPFPQPRGLSLKGETLYVADTGDHTVSAVDLKTGERRILAGDGQLGKGRVSTSLRSPWDVLAHGSRLYIAMAGTHQIWMLVDEKNLQPYAGNGREALVDGPLTFASFNQPAGLALTDAEELVVADSEASALRIVEGRAVTTAVGTGLFDFGDQDGVGKEALLQHPQGLTSGNGLIYVADSFNHKVKSFDPRTREVKTVVAGLHEPEGLVFHRNVLYIADTNAHRIVRHDLQTRSIELVLAPGWHLQRLLADGQEATPATIPQTATTLEIYACNDAGLCSVAQAPVDTRVEVHF